jgi:sulfite oxidase
LLQHFPQFKDDHPNNHAYHNHHVEFEGADGYSTSVPLSRLLDPECDALVCWEMNGEPLPPDHGYPVRVLLPGITGARSVKWIRSMRIQPNESQSTFTQHYYKDPNGKAIQEMPLQSFITSKTTVQGQGSNSNELHVQGVAWGGASGTGISKVEVAVALSNSNSDGKKVMDWMPTILERSSNYDSSRVWSWVLWRAVISFDHGDGEEVPMVTCRATNGKGEKQPETFWYPKGYLYNGWHSM